MKRELFMDNALNNDESMKSYTGLPTLDENKQGWLNFNLFDGNIQYIETFGWETEVLGH